MPSASVLAIRIGSEDDALTLDVADDGRGLPQDWQRRGHFGVRGMHERARALGGEVTIENRDEGGTRVHRAAAAGMTMTKTSDEQRRSASCSSTITRSCASAFACCSR